MGALTSTGAASSPPGVSMDPLFGRAPTMTDAQRIEMLERDVRELRAVLWHVWVRACEGHPGDRPSGPAAAQTAWEQITPIFHRWLP
jgi:hypothetical protein